MHIIRRFNKGFFNNIPVKNIILSPTMPIKMLKIKSNSGETGAGKAFLLKKHLEQNSLVSEKIFINIFHIHVF